MPDIYTEYEPYEGVNVNGEWECRWCMLPLPTKHELINHMRDCQYNKEQPPRPRKKAKEPPTEQEIAATKDDLVDLLRELE